jgi:hypothetical protein
MIRGFITALLLLVSLVPGLGQFGRGFTVGRLELDGCQQIVVAVGFHLGGEFGEHRLDALSLGRIGGEVPSLERIRLEVEELRAVDVRIARMLRQEVRGSGIEAGANDRKSLFAPLPQTARAVRRGAR